MKFIFDTDKESQVFCESIVKEIVRLYELEENDAVKGINLFWGHISKLGEDDLIYHEMPDYWAEEVYKYYQKNNCTESS